ncbi:MAG: carboxymuconolactone decarboxylase family protein [Bacteroidaceae bacterium]|nr:carboxymuconolactone decarboxylase family protein [Bacteroidaceae bacterium]
MKTILTALALMLSIGADAQEIKQDNMIQEVDFNVWPKGDLNTAFAKYFTGKSYLAALDTENGGPMNVTFEPRCRNNWHIHHKSVQVLVCVAGRGWYVEEGKQPVELRPGVVVATPAEAKHWHGAAKDSWMQHVTYMTKVEEGSSTTWLEPVTDEEYDKLHGSAAPQITTSAEAYHERMFPGYKSDFKRTDPEFIERFDNFAFDEVIRQTSNRLDDRTRFICYLATLLGCQGIDEYRALLPAALNMGVTPVEVKEIVYQATAYLGIGRVFPFLKATNEIFEQRGIALPLPPQAQTTQENRREAGTQAQVECFGEGMRDFWKSGPEDSRHINYWLADNCFGDYYTRTGLDMKYRELITFCFLAAQGGCEPQLKGHIAGNYHVGNDKDFLIAVISSNLPFIGYPRTLNALNCIREVEAANK